MVLKVLENVYQKQRCAIQGKPTLPLFELWTAEQGGVQRHADLSNVFCLRHSLLQRIFPAGVSSSTCAQKLRPCLLWQGCCELTALLS